MQDATGRQKITIKPSKCPGTCRKGLIFLKYFLYDWQKLVKERKLIQ